MARNYRKEYDDYHGTPEQKNRDRAKAEKEGRVRDGDGREVDHVAKNRKGKLGSKVRVISKKANRKKQPKRDGSED
jgi:hypothetical protein